MHPLTKGSPMPNTHDALVQQIDAKEETFGELFAAMDSEVPYEGQEASEALHELPLEVRVTKTITMVFCTGGPHVEATAELHPNGGISDVTIRGWRGGERVERVVDSDSPIHRAVEHYTQDMMPW